MSVSFRSKRFSTLLIGLVLLLIAQVKCQGAWTRICENGQTVAWLSSNTGLMSPSGGGVSGSGRCLSSSNPPRFDITRAPTTFNFPVAGRTLLCGTNNGCPSVAPVQPWTRICENGQTVAWLSSNTGLMSPSGGGVSGSGQCLSSSNPPRFDMIRAPTTFNFPIAGRTLLCGTNNGCPSVAPVQPWTRICENGQTVAWLSSNTGLMSPSGGGVSGSGQCLSSSNPPRFDIIRAPTTFNFPVAGRTLLCGTNNGCPSVNPGSSRSSTNAICDGGRIVGWLGENGELLPPAGVNAAGSGRGRCSRVSGGPWLFTLTARPTTFTISSSNQLRCGPGGICPNP